MTTRNEPTPFRLIETMSIEEITDEAEDLTTLMSAAANNVEDILWSEEDLGKMSGLIEMKCVEILKMNVRFGELTEIMVRMAAKIPW